MRITGGSLRSRAIRAPRGHSGSGTIRARSAARARLDSHLRSAHRPVSAPDTPMTISATFPLVRRSAPLWLLVLVTFSGTKLSIYDPERAKTSDFIQRLRAFVPAAVVSAVEEPSGAFDVVINASPVGMNAGDPISIPAALVEGADAVVDIVAAPTTRLRELALARRKIVVAGHAMVRAQAQLLRRFICSGAASEADTIRAEGVTGIPTLATL